MVAPMIADLYARQQKQELQKMLTYVAYLIVGVCLPVCLALAIGGYWILEQLGPAFGEGYAALIILMIGQLVNVGCGSVCYLMIMTKYQRQAMYIYLVGTLRE